MRRIRANITFLAMSVCLMLLPRELHAQPTAAADAPQGNPLMTLAPTQIEQFQKSVEASTDLADADKAQIAELTQQALTDLKGAEQSQRQASSFEDQAAAIDADRAALEQQLAQPTQPTTVATDRAVTELESERVATQTKITELEQQLKLPAFDAAARTDRRKSLRTLVADLPAKVIDVEQQFKASPPDGEPPLLTEARKIALAAQWQAVSTRLQAAQKELALYDAEDAVNLPTLRRDVKTRERNSAQKRLEALNAEINRQRQREAQRRAEEAELAALTAQPLLKEIWEESQEIARREQELRSRHEADKQLLQEVQTRFREIHDDALEAERLDRDVTLAKMGLWLRKQRDSLRDLPALYAKITERADDLAEAELALHERKDQLEGLADLEALADKLTVEASRDGSLDLDAFREDAVEVFQTQQVNLEKLEEEYRGYTLTLADLNKHHQLLVDEAQKYAEFLDERILWVRSHQPISIAALREELASLGEGLHPSVWLSRLRNDVQSHLLLYAGMGLVLLSSVGGRRRQRRRLQETAKAASGRVTISILPTLRCLTVTLWLAIPWPGLFLFLSWRLYESSRSAPDQHVAAVNLAQLAGVAFLLEFVRQAIRSGGLAAAHFGWNGKTLRHVRRLLWPVIIFGVPIAMVIAFRHHPEPGSRPDGIERLFFMGAMLVLVHFAHGLFHPSRGALRQTRALQSGGWLDRLDSLWYLLGVGTPLVLAGFALWGYYDTALQLAGKIQSTAWVIVVAIFLHAFLVRWLMLRHRRLRIDQARERRTAAQEESHSAPESGAPIPEAVAEAADLESINEQSRRLVSTTILVAGFAGLWLTWSDVVPAIRFLDRWPIWETTIQTMESVEVEDDTTRAWETRPKYEIHAVTIASLIEVLLIIVLTVTAARNLPGLLEISVLARLPIDRSTSYAITSLTRYALTLIGLILASRVLGIGWSKVQWLAAALTFGLGFGLQEIFANFVSGIIILFEQPVRVGDVVTIDGVSGVVNRIRIRATTIVDWDRKEYIVPNREFITGRLLNWTLSDKMNRVVINVGVKYGSDTNLVRATIMQVLHEHENVLDDPAPLVTFEAFGESSLDFVVRAYLPNLDQRLETVHQLHSLIHDRLSAAGIEIPFPQRDLHLRTGVVVENPPRSESSTNGHAERSAAKTEELRSE